MMTIISYHGRRCPVDTTINTVLCTRGLECELELSDCYCHTLGIILFILRGTTTVLYCTVRYRTKTNSSDKQIHTAVFKYQQRNYKNK